MKKTVATIKKEKPEDVFSCPFNSNLVHQVAVSQMANRRQSIAHTKDRSEVRGGGKKPWRQKGTGRARHGSIRSPIWVGGGVAFGPRTEKVFQKRIPKNVKRKALLMILAEKKRNNELVVVESMGLKDMKTKPALEFLKKHSLLKQSCLIVLKDMDKKAILAFRNIPKIKTIQFKDLNCLDVLLAKNIVLTEDCLEEIKKLLTKE
ncbi:MAG: 50S ribosomal protein L4 [Candidatus Paceibacterota bacterium]|jgi:large subunit ribosomal protein L4|nr:50S ribosomal protein L4 [Candidatus Paceibacterota bacterium]MDD5555265.1 50S ribosomal protein L4 [Candidatus Paceibacterota bacterium]